MAFSGNFTVTPTSDPAIFILTDVSTGTDNTITGRQVFLIQSDNTYLVPDGTLTNYIVWPIADSSITINALKVDTALNVVVDWITPTPNIGNDYEQVILVCFDGFGNQAGFNLLTDINSNPVIIQDTNYFYNLIKFTCLIVGAENAVTVGGAITLSQELLDMETYMQQNETILF